MKKLKKYFALLAFVSLVFQVVLGQQVTRNEAINAAVSALQIKGDINATLLNMDSVFVMNKNNHTLLYEVRFKNGETVLLSGHKACLPILGFYKVAKQDAPVLSQNELIPEGLKDILRDYANQNEECFKTRGSIMSHAFWDTLLLFNPEKNNRAMLNTVVDPMLTTQWGQNESNDTDPQYVAYYTYNYYAPNGANCTRCNAGCSAVAMAQIVNYWSYPQGIPQWCSTTDYAWNNMPDEIILKNNGNYTLQREAVARLIADCGTAMNMSYCTNNDCSSSTYQTSQITNAFHLYGYNDAYEYKESQCASHAAWVTKVAWDIFNGYPVFYTAYGYKNDEQYVGHAFVCHGYNTSYNNTKYFNINWGWNGIYDGMFTLDLLNPSSYTFNLYHEAVFNIYPSFCWQNIIMECNKTFYNGTTKSFVTQGWFKNNGYNYVVNSGADVTIDAADILLTNGFYAASGSSFRARIAPCTNSSLLLDETDLNQESSSDTLPATKSLQKMEDNVLNGMTLYPNPTTGNINISFANGEENARQVVVSNLLGVAVIRQENPQGNTIDASPLTPGMYVVRVQTQSGNTYFGKFVKK